MTNREKYDKELHEIWESVWQFSIDRKDKTLRKCSPVMCNDCLFYAVDTSCISRRKEWLKQEYIEPVKTVKASELAVDTVVLCANDEKLGKEVRKFGTIFRGKLYSQYQYSEDLRHWNYMWLEDGTVVLPE